MSKTIYTLLVVLTLAGFGQALINPPIMQSLDSTLGGDSIEARDVDRDGTTELILASFEKSASYVYLLDNRSNLIWRNKISSIYPNDQPLIATVADIDQDSREDILVFSVIPLSGNAIDCTASRATKSFLFRLTRVEDPEQCNGRMACNFREWADEYGYVLDLTINDMDGDGDYEAIIGRRDFQVSMVDGDGSVLWDYETEGSVNSVLTADIDADGVVEVLVGSYRMLHVLSNTSTVEWRYNVGEKVLDIAVGDMDANGLAEIYAVTGDDRVVALDHQGNEIWSFTLALIRETIATGKMHDLSGGNIFTAKQERIYAYHLNGTLEWVFETGETVFRLTTADLNGDGLDELISLNKKGLAVFTINPDYVAEIKGFEKKGWADKYYEEKNYSQAIEYAQSCSLFFESIELLEEADHCRTVVSNSLSQLEALKYMTVIQEAYNNEDFARAQNISLIAYNLYMGLKETELAQEAYSFIERSTDQLNAQYYREQAIEYYRAGAYQRGYEYANKATELYRSAGDTSDWNAAAKLAHDAATYEAANTNLSLAFKNYERNQLETALKNAVNARNGFELLKDEVKSTQATNIIVRVNDTLTRLEKTFRGKRILRQAQEEFNRTEYVKCKSTANDALTLFMEAGEPSADLQPEAEKILGYCRIGANATRYYSMALEYYGQQKYYAAEDYAFQARDLYRSIGDWEHSIMCDELTVSIDGALRGIEERQRASQISQIMANRLTYFLILFPLLLLFFAILVFLYSEREEIRSIIAEFTGKRTAKMDAKYPLPLGGEIELSDEDIKQLEAEMKTTMDKQEASQAIQNIDEKQDVALADMIEGRKREVQSDKAQAPQSHIREDVAAQLNMKDEDEPLDEFAKIRKQLKDLDEKLQDED